MVSKILVPVDGSKASQKAANYAVDLAKQTGASLTLLSVIDKRIVGSLVFSDFAPPAHVRESIEGYLHQAAQSNMARIVKVCERYHIRHKTAIRTGHPAEEIMSEATKSKVDLIVMGSHGKSALKAAVFGSVTYGVMHKDTKIPILIVRR
ncbi:MAG TPA: universal stress protein [Nitrospirota bacterium]|nr:universal stress protein [Nitrospirota bacterium]